MARAPDARYEQAYELFKQGKKLVEIASQLNLPDSTVRRWKCTHKWDSERSDNKNERSGRKRGGQPGNHNATGPPGNKNAVGNPGGAAPLGNKNAVKHGAYENIYKEFLPEDEKEIYESIPDDDTLSEEIRLMRLKLARLIGRENVVTFDMFGNRHERELTEPERETGIIACVSELRKLIKTKKQIEIAEAKATGGSGGNEDQVAELLRGLVDDLNE